LTRPVSSQIRGLLASDGPALTLPPADVEIRALLLLSDDGGRVITAAASDGGAAVRAADSTPVLVSDHAGPCICLVRCAQMK
jgi:hypothetical protein